MQASGRERGDLALHATGATFILDPARSQWKLEADGRTVLRGRLGATLPAGPERVEPGEATVTLAWPAATLTIRAREDRFHLAWQGEGVALEDRFDLASGQHWYGGGETVRQHWPLESLRLEMAPFQIWDQGPTGLGNVLHPLWSTASGAAIAADPTLPLHVSLNGPKETPPERPWLMSAPLEAAQQASSAQPEVMPLVDREGSGDGWLRLRAEPDEQGHSALRYTLSAHPDPVAAQQHLLAGVPNPRGVPARAMWEAPIWTTWARYKMAINQKWVLAFADEIVAHEFPRSIMEIDDKWQSEYGNLEFDPVKFPDPGTMVARLHDQGFLVTLWVMPFASPTSEAFREGARAGYWVTDDTGEPGIFRWWQGPGAALDVTNPAAVDWYVARLRRLQERCGVDGYKFDAGEPCFLPRHFRTHEPILPNEYTHLYVERVASQFNLAEVRSAYGNQSAPIWVRLWDRFSTWGLDNGLQSMIPASLTFGILGYPWVLPDMIGGNAYGEGFPDRELFVRWVQVNALLPSLQFSIAPWDYDQEVVELSRRAVAWHTEVTPTLLRLAEEALETGHPPVRPLFWLDPDDPETYTIGDQFALGNDIIVAPVVEPGARQRDLYLPAGEWTDVLRGDVLDGGRWVRGYPAPLDHLPWFERRRG